MSEPNEQQNIVETQNEGDLQVKSNISAGDGPLPGGSSDNGITSIGGIKIDTHTPPSPFGQ